MGITADDYKRVVNRMLYLEEQIRSREQHEEFQQSFLKDLLTKLTDMTEGYNIRTAQYEKLLDFYITIREASHCVNAESAEWVLYWRTASSCTSGRIEWREDENALPVRDAGHA